MNEQERAAFAEAITNTELDVRLTWGQCNLIDAMIILVRSTGDLAEYNQDLTAIGNAITDAMVSSIEHRLEAPMD
jgi:hypothetical protein